MKLLSLGLFLGACFTFLLSIAEKVPHIGYLWSFKHSSIHLLKTEAWFHRVYAGTTEVTHFEVQWWPPDLRYYKLDLLSRKLTLYIGKPKYDTGT